MTPVAIELGQRQYRRLNRGRIANQLTDPDLPTSFSHFDRREKKIPIVVAEVRERRDRLHCYTVNLAVSIEAERHVGRFDGLVVEPRDERVVLPMLQHPTHAWG